MSVDTTTHDFNNMVEQLSVRVSYIRKLIIETYASVIEASAHAPLYDTINRKRLLNIEIFCFNLLSDIHSSL